MMLGFHLFKADDESVMFKTFFKNILFCFILCSTECLSPKCGFSILKLRWYPTPNLVLDLYMVR